MTAKQIAQKLRDKGFIIETARNLIFASLSNRSVSTTEIVIALDWEIERCHIWRMPGGSIGIIGLEE